MFGNITVPGSFVSESLMTCNSPPFVKPGPIMLRLFDNYTTPIDEKTPTKLDDAAFMYYGKYIIVLYIIYICYYDNDGLI
jgi:hypothetical protein